MAHYTEESISFPVNYVDETQMLQGFVFRPTTQTAEQRQLPPVVFNSGFTGGVSMYGQLFSKALAALGYNVLTYDVAGFFSNKKVRNTRVQGGITVTNVSLEDQKQEVLAAVACAQQLFGQMPALLSWAMGSVASLAAVVELARNGKEQIPYYVPMSYTSMRALQNLRVDKKQAHEALMALDDGAAIPPFDTGTEATRLGYYPLDHATQAYVEKQLGGYTDAMGAEHWPGCTHVSAKSYKAGVMFDPEASLGNATGKFPPAMIVHGTENSLHHPDESVRLHKLYPGKKTSVPVMVLGMEHGQQLNAGNPVFQYLIYNIDRGIRSLAA